MSEENTVLISYDGANQHSLSAGKSDLVRLNPGTNVVDADVWSRILAAAEKEAEKTGIRGGVLYLLDNDLAQEVPAGEGGGVDLSKLNAGDAIKVVEAELDLDNLNMMLAAENGRSKPRATVVTAIKNQISAIEEAYAGEE